MTASDGHALAATAASGQSPPGDHGILALLWQHGSDLCSLHAPDGSVRCASPSYERQLGHPPEGLVGHGLQDLLHPADRRPARTAFTRATSRQPERMTLRLRAADGTYTAFDTTMQGTNGPEGAGVLVVARAACGHDTRNTDQHRRDRFLRLLIDLAVRSMNRPVARVDATIDEVLAAAGEFTGADRAYLFRYDLAHARMTNTHEWCRTGIAPMRPQLQAVAMDSAGDLHDRLRRNGVAAVEDVSCLAPDDRLRATLEAQAVRSIVALPLRDGEEVLGFVGLDSVGRTTRWDTDDLDLLRVVAELCANAVLRRQRADDLDRSRLLLHTAGVAAGFGGWTFEFETGQVSLSEPLAHLLGLEPGPGGVARQVLRRVPAADRRVLFGEARRSGITGEAWDLELRVATPDGERRRFRTLGRTEEDEHGRIRRLWGAAQDVTEHRRTEEELERLGGQLTATMEAVSDGIALFDADRRLTYANTQLGEVLALGPDELLGHRLGGSMPLVASALLETPVTRALQEREPQTSLERSAAGKGRWLEIRAYPHGAGVAVYVRDVTDPVERQQAMERAAEADRTAAARLRELDQAKNAFLSAVSHELRTPLTVILGTAETMRSRREQLHDGLRANLEDALVDHSQQLSRLLDELLQLDRLTRGQLSPDRHRFDLVALSRTIIDRHGTGAPVSLEAPGYLPVHLDPVQTEHVLANLLVNAAKYAERSPVAVTVAPHGAGGAVIEVADQGPGIAPEDLERVFEPFVRLDAEHPRPGTGIGLALVAEFARLHGGRAEAVDTGRRGARIRVELPGPPSTGGTD